MPRTSKKRPSEAVRQTDPQSGYEVGTGNTNLCPHKKKFKVYLLVIWNSHWDPPCLHTGPWIYIRAGREICPKSQREHWQCWFRCKNQRYPGPVREDVEAWLGSSGFKLIACNGTEEQNDDYSRKDGDHYEWGARPQQGKRTDLDSLASQILEGHTTVEAITTSEPVSYHQYGRTLERIQDIALRQQFRTAMTEGVWIWGPTGSGKSHMAYENFSPATHYVWPNDGGWWDGYCGQAIVILNDFRGEIPYNQMLQMIDKWPFTVRRRSREPFPFLAKKVIITSSLPPEAIYHRRDAEDSLEQLLRRLTIIHLQGNVEHIHTQSRPQPHNETDDNK